MRLRNSERRRGRACRGVGGVDPLQIQADVVELSWMRGRTAYEKHDDVPMHRRMSK